MTRELSRVGDFRVTRPRTDKAARPRAGKRGLAGAVGSQRLYGSGHESAEYGARLLTDAALEIGQRFLAASLAALLFVQKDRQRPE